MIELVRAFKGDSRFVHLYNIMKEFHDNIDKYEPLKGFHVYIKRNELSNELEVTKLENENKELLNKDRLIYHESFSEIDYYDNTIKIEYLGSDIDLGIKPYEIAIISRNDNGKLYVVYKEKYFNEDTKCFIKYSEEFIKYLFSNKDKSSYIYKSNGELIY